MEEIELKVNGMMCQHCASHVKDALLKVKGVKKVEVDLKNNKATVTGKNLDRSKLISSVIDAGYSAE